MEFRPADIMGDSFANRIRFIRDKANDARVELNSIAETALKGKQINLEYKPFFKDPLAVLFTLEGSKDAINTLRDKLD